VIGRSVLGLLLALASGSARTLAQVEAPPAAERPARREAFRMVDAYVVSNLQESLGLTDEEYARAIPLVRKLQTARREYYLERTRTLREMRRLLQRGGATETQVRDLLQRLKALDAEAPVEARRNQEALDAALTPVQQAKYRVLELEVEQRMRAIVNRTRPRTRRGAGPPPE
jgi:Spy/CpxP family protein refolding chaperone